MTATGYRSRKLYREGIAERQLARAGVDQSRHGRHRRGYRKHYHADYGNIGRPRPLAQSLWPFATVIMAAVMLWAVGDSLAAADGAARQTSFTSQDLLDMAEAATVPAGPSLSVSVPEQTPAAGLDQVLDVDPVLDLAPHIDVAPDIDVESADSPPGLIAAPRLMVPDAAPVGPEARGLAALDVISYPWRELLPGWTIEFLPEADGLYGLTLVKEKRIEIYVRENQGTGLLAHVIAHELGHAVDVTYNNSSDRERWETSRGIDSEPWWPGSGATDFSTGAGDFAEAFAAWQVGDQSFRSTLGNPPTGEQEALLAELSLR